jgi:hypothetical protein
VDLDYSVSASLLAPSLYYGVTDWLSVGFGWPIYLHASTTIHHLEVGTGNLGYNSRYPEDPDRARPVVPATHPSAVTGTEGVLRLAEEYFEYDPVQDWEDQGPAFYRHTVLGSLGISTLAPYKKQKFPVPLYGNLLLSKTFSDDDDQASLMGIAQVGLYFAFF